jgi:Ca-activated chloride channel family protein
VDRASLRARSRARQTFGLGVRVLGWLLLVTALANPLLATGTDTLSTAFVVDRSASVSPAEQQAALAWITRAIQAKRPSDQVAVVSFAGDAAVEQGLTATPPSIGLTAQLDAAHTDVAAALRLAEGILPPGGARRIVLLTDGNENRGQALGEVATLQAAGIPVDVVPLPSGTSPDVAVQGLNVSPAIHQGERFTINVTISATGDTAAQLRVLVDDRLDSTQALQLHAGQNNVVLSHDPLPPGMHRLSAVVEAPNDTVPENNVGYATLQVVGPPRVLLVEGTPGEARYLTPALTAAGLSVAVAAPSVLSGDVTGLRPYDVIGLVNVPAPAIGVGGLLALRS